MSAPTHVLLLQDSHAERVAITAIFHIADKQEWENALLQGFYDRSTRGRSRADIGFIHCSVESQVQPVANFVFDGYERDLVLLEMNLEELAEAGLEIRFEYGGNGELYPHIYGDLPCHLVRSASLFTRG